MATSMKTMVLLLISTVGIAIAMYPLPAAASNRRLLTATITISEVTFAGPDGVTLSAVRYEPSDFSTGSDFPAVVMMHGCSGMWSNKNTNARNSDGTPNLQNHIEKWGLKLANSGAVALAVDSFTPRGVQQDQCGGNSVVNPYTTRVLDARAAYTYLTGIPGGKVASTRVALLGWSHGAQSVMVEAAATPRDSNTLRPASDKKFIATVSFYPGCGTALGFGSTVAGSYWRPYGPKQLHVGTSDSFYTNCATRVAIAGGPTYATDVIFPDYPSAPHSFDAFSQTWPTSKCAVPFTGEECAMRAADIDALAFLDSQLNLP